MRTRAIRKVRKPFQYSRHLGLFFPGLKVPRIGCRSKAVKKRPCLSGASAANKVSEQLCVNSCHKNAWTTSAAAANRQPAKGSASVPLGHETRALSAAWAQLYSAGANYGDSLLIQGKTRPLKRYEYFPVSSCFLEVFGVGLIAFGYGFFGAEERVLGHVGGITARGRLSPQSLRHGANVVRRGATAHAQIVHP